MDRGPILNKHAQRADTTIDNVFNGLELQAAELTARSQLRGDEVKGAFILCQCFSKNKPTLLRVVCEQGTNY